MDNRINIAELLKDCPSIELYSPIFGNVYLCGIRPSLAVIVKTSDNQKEEFLYDGRFSINGECMLFPSKENRDWNTFQRPFKNGDIVVTTLGNIAIISEHIKKELFYIHALMIGDKFYNAENTQVSVKRLATEKEKEELFKAIKEHGYKWNAETKTLERLPKFKVGDRVLWNYDTEIPRTISKVELSSKRGYVYWIDCKGCSSGWWDETELTPIPNKFDINTLIPFESRVLVRNCKDEIWLPVVWGLYDDEDAEYPYNCSGFYYAQCISYEGNEHLIGKTVDCDNFYKIWKK